MRIISGKYGRRRFDVPTHIKARPTTDFARENLFNVLQNLLDFEGMKALDLFAGTGAISFELASRGCRRVVAVENYPVQYNFIRKVATQLDAREILPIKGDVFRFVMSGKVRFHLCRPALRSTPIRRNRAPRTQCRAIGSGRDFRPRTFKKI